MKRYLTFMVLILINTITFSQTIGGNLRILNISGLTVRAELTVYGFNTNNESPIIQWGDNSFDTLVFENEGSYFNDYTSTRYAKNHTFPGPGVYNISINCNDYLIDLNNVENSSQKSLQFSMICKFSGNLINSPASFTNNTAIDLANTSSIYIFNPNAYDADGDSLVYELISCVDSTYTLPTASNIFDFNSETGDIYWDKPTSSGYYMIAYLIREFRSGIQINSNVRVFTINVNQNSNISNMLNDEIKTIIYPNPCTTEVFIKSSVRIKTVEIYNALGLMIKKIECSPIFDLKIKTSDLIKGTYFTRVIDEWGDFQTYTLTR